jgi:hypothetical protein
VREKNGRLTPPRSPVSESGHHVPAGLFRFLARPSLLGSHYTRHTRVNLVTQQYTNKHAGGLHVKSLAVGVDDLLAGIEELPDHVLLPYRCRKRADTETQCAGSTTVVINCSVLKHDENLIGADSIRGLPDWTQQKAMRILLHRVTAPR